MLIGATTWTYQIHEGLGAAGYHPPVMWGVYIITFVFWVGIGHAGTLISAILYLFRAGFRTSIYRVSEAMTGVRRHDGRTVPNPASWPALEVFLADPVSELATHLAESKESARVGRLRDSDVPHNLEHLLVHRIDSGHRDPARSREESNPQGDSRAAVVGLAKFGSRMAALYARVPVSRRLRDAARLVSALVVSFDFAMALTPGWHATIFPPYFVAGAIFSGIGMVFTIAIPLRKAFKLEHYITLNDLDAAAKLCLFTSCVVGLAYLTEFQVAWMSGNKYEQDYFWNRVFGQWAWAAWIMLICNMVLPMSLWSQKLRRNPKWLFILSLFINLGMWFERFVIVVPSLSHEFEPWQWGTYRPTWVDYGILLGSFGWFFMWFLLFIKQLPVMAMAEIKEVLLPRLKVQFNHSHDLPEGIDFPDETGKVH
jgi:molybdopterin-containing oxidoreductase family membrane subunit